MWNRLARHKMATVLITIFIGIVSVELFARFALGLGDPPIYVADPQIEYMLKPDQNVRRFGNLIFVNHWGMRSHDFPARKANPDEIRILILGDSVINGGSQIDQALLSTTLLQKRLQASLGKPVVVGNASAGSWGPGNWLAYVRRYGFFEVDLVVLMVNSGDYADNPTFAPLDANHPDARPLMALQEAVFRYLPRFLPQYPPALAKPPATPAATVSPTEIARGMSDLRQFLTLAQSGGGVES